MSFHGNRVDALLSHLRGDERNARRGWPYPSEEQIAAELGLSTEGLRWAAAILIERGLVDADEPYRLAKTTR